MCGLVYQCRGSALCLCVSQHRVAVMSVVMEQFVNPSGSITAPLRERSGFSIFTRRWCGIEEMRLFNSVSEEKVLAWLWAVPQVGSILPSPWGCLQQGAEVLLVNNTVSAPFSCLFPCSHRSDQPSVSQLVIWFMGVINCRAERNKNTKHLVF